MLKKNMKYKAILLVLFPLIIGFLIEKLLLANITNGNQLYSSLGGLLLAIWTYSSLIFWFYVGWVFGKFKMATIKRFILGNIVWAISLILYFWQPAITEYYSIGFASVSINILSLFTNSSNTTTIIVFSYFLMLLVFSLGFIFAVRYKPLKTEQA
ncbi:MAG: hypothetical protein RBR71_11035 [Gudongella sp.]|nr:hypothetical protein [Gudongella sp.]